MTTIHVQRIGTSPGYRAWIHGQHDWCYGFGCTWKEAVGDLLHTFEATLGLGVHVAPELDPRPGVDTSALIHVLAAQELEPRPLDGLAPENACQCHTDTSPSLERRLAGLGTMEPTRCLVCNEVIEHRIIDGSRALICSCGATLLGSDQPAADGLTYPEWRKQQAQRTASLVRGCNRKTDPELAERAADWEQVP